MKCKNKLIKLLFAMVLAAGLLSCASGPVIREFPDTANPREEFTKLNSDLNTARMNQVDVLAPESFEEAEEFLTKAKASLDEQKDRKDTLAYIARGRAYLDQANSFAEVGRANIKDVTLARQRAIKAEAPKFFEDDFRKADKDLMDVTSDIEKNKLQNAIKYRSDLQLAYLDLELRSIKHAQLGSAKNTIEQAIKEGAEDFAPQNLAMAKDSVQTTEAFITANRHRTSEINSRAEETRKSANRLLRITRDAKSGKKMSPEDLAMARAHQRSKLSEKQTMIDNRDEQLESSHRQLITGANVKRSLERENERLESDQSFNQLFEEARKSFSEDEAEVYKQGNTLAIRLKGLNFPVSRAELAESNFPLLEKVQDVIENFGSSSVIIEGHTDSTGGKALNKRLSLNRASAVREYLLTRTNGQPVTIKAVGFDFQKPLATNKTSSGRAQNRRVDVLISPNTSTANPQETYTY